MENRLNFNSMLSLKEMSLRRIGVAMCNTPSLFNKISTFGVDQRKLAISYHSDIIHNLSNLWLPESLKKQMVPIIRAVCDEMTRWKLFNEHYFDGYIYARFFRYLSWTTAGTINYQKTAYKLVLSFDELLDPLFRFQLACFYCLENFIPTLWRELPDESKKDYYDGDISKVKEPNLQLFLPIILERAELTLFENEFRDSPELAPPSDSIELAACLGNKTLFDYYFAKLEKGVKKATLLRTTAAVLRFRDAMYCDSFNIERNFLSSVLLHLLSLMTAEEHNQLFKELPCEVIGCFLDWPRQDLFLDIADVMWTFLPESKYEQLFKTLTCAFTCHEHSFRNLFHEFFPCTPVHFRKFFADGDCRNNSRFWEFISEDAETTRVVLRCLDPSDRMKFVFSEGGAFLIYNMQDNWPLMEVFFREINLNKMEKWSLKVAVIGHMRRNGIIKWVKKDLGNFFEFMDEWEPTSQKKRSSEDETSTEVKRLCLEKQKNSSL